MRTGISRGLLCALVFGFGAAACGYDPNPVSGMLKCGPSDTCPDNYTCINQTCWRNGGSVDKFLGHWVSDPATAKRVRICTDTTNETIAWNDYLDVGAGTTSALRANYYCDWNLDVDATGNATTIRAGSMCSAADPNDPTVTFTWHGQALTLTTTNGKDGTIAMSLPYDYVTATGSGSCMLNFTGPMTKN